MVELIDLYFNHANIFIPVLHRPTLERGIADGLHRNDASFGGVVLLVCAIASRYSNDHRVFLSNTGSALSAGWKWFEQIHMIKKPVLTPPCLHDLQIHSVSTMFILPAQNSQIVLALRYIFARHRPCSSMLDYGRHRHPPRARSRLPSAKDVRLHSDCRRRIMETCFLVCCDNDD